MIKNSLFYGISEYSVWDGGAELSFAYETRNLRFSIPSF